MCNAVSGTDYTDVDAIEITTLSDAIYIKMKNDISFLIDSEMNLFEHQSTLSEYASSWHGIFCRTVWELCQDEYAHFIKLAREYSKSMGVKEAIDLAIEEVRKKSVMKKCVK